MRIMNIHQKIGRIRLLVYISISLLYTLALADNHPKLPSLNYTTSESGNPFVQGPFSDPAPVYYNASGLYWVFATTSVKGVNNTISPAISAFSSPDLIDWSAHENVLNMSSFKWANASLFSPAPVFSDGLYYLYFAASGHPVYANGTRRDQFLNIPTGNFSGIGVGVARTPEGPYTNVNKDGSPLISAKKEHIHTSKPYGPSILVDHDKNGGHRTYIYYGIENTLYVRELDKIPASSKNSSHTVIAKNDNFKGARVFKRKDKYYLLWNNGAGNPPRIQYSEATSPLGPFSESKGTVLAGDPTVANYVYHGDVLDTDPDADIWYLFYERRQSLSEASWDSNKNASVDSIRGLAYDRLYFADNLNANSTKSNDTQASGMIPVKMLVKNNFQRSSYFNNSLPLGWAHFGSGETSLASKHSGNQTITSLQLHQSPGSNSTSDLKLERLSMPTNFTNLQFTVGISMDGSNQVLNGAGSWAGVLFRGRTTNNTQAVPNDLNFLSYYAGITLDGQVILGKIGPETAGNLALLESVTVPAPAGGPGHGNGNGGNTDAFTFRPEAWHYLRIRAENSTVSVFVDRWDKALFQREIVELEAGWTGLQIWGGVESANFRELEILSL